MIDGWKTCALGDVCVIKYGKDHKHLDNGEVPVYGSGGIIRYVNTMLYNKKSVLIPRKGTLKNLFFVNDPFWTVDTLFYTQINEAKIVPEYLYYFLKTINLETMNVGTAVPSLTVSVLSEIKMSIPSLDEQKRIASILSALDDKIELNKKINKTLEEMAQSFYCEMFVNTTNDQRSTCRVEEYFDVTIGKTPPRKEHQWFTTNTFDVTWVSISDMASCGTYIINSSEKLIQEAVDKFNIKVVPNNTVILSFKLTVGRVAITYGEMSTNEAIAHFKTDNSFISEYMYFYLKYFNYQALGSTSSIATAVNSKIIKDMPFIIPTNDEIYHFHSLVSPIFRNILNNQIENIHLSSLRDTLLPKLMSGEIRVK